MILLIVQKLKATKSEQRKRKVNEKRSVYIRDLLLSSAVIGELGFFHPHLTMAEPHVRPAPKPAAAIVCPD